jgi:cell division protein FtsB
MGTETKLKELEKLYKEITEYTIPELKRENKALRKEVDDLHKGLKWLRDQLDKKENKPTGHYNPC